MPDHTGDERVSHFHQDPGFTSDFLEVSLKFALRESRVKRILAQEDLHLHRRLIHGEILIHSLIRRPGQLTTHRKAADVPQRVSLCGCSAVTVCEPRSEERRVGKECRSRWW